VGTYKTKVKKLTDETFTQMRNRRKISERKFTEFSKNKLNA
jgi:hypothetical protein